MFELKVGWRNILRHRRRSLVTLLAVVTGVVSIILFGGFVQANYEGLRESVIRSQYGHLQVYQEGYEAKHRSTPEKVRLSKQESEKIVSIMERDPHFIAASRRIEFTGLLGNEKQSQAAVIRAVDPDAESLINSALTIIDGNDLDSSDAEGVLLGEGLAQSLNAKTGDSLTLVSATVGGAMNAVDVRVQGIFRSFAKEYDDRAMMMPLSQAQRVLGTDAVDMVVLLIDDTSKLKGVKAALGASLKQAGLHTEMQTWDQLASFYHRVVELYDGIFLFVIIVIAVVVLFGITNTMMIAVMERTAEIGTLRAIGTRQTGIVKQFVVEGLVLAALSSVVGVLIGVALSRGITGLEVMMPPPPGSSRGYPLRIALVPWVWMVSAFGVWAIAALATLFPAINASRKSIVDALRHV
ncbi:MAG: uncharacterized protein JWL63_1113 [Rhodocyclales bacterium]|nr:uncharacterized protein [Rhodocyclales bacterium]